MTTEARNETWKPVRGFEGLYEVSNYGRVKSLAKFRKTKSGYVTKDKILNGYYKNEYPIVCLRKDNKRFEHYIHRLVAIAFLGYKGNMEVNHIDGCRTNNFIMNLEWTSHSGNIKHAYNTGLCKPFWKNKVMHNAIAVIAINQTSIIEFPSIDVAAKEFKKDRRRIQKHIFNNQPLDGFNFYYL